MTTPSAPGAAGIPGPVSRCRSVVIDPTDGDQVEEVMGSLWSVTCGWRIPGTGPG